MVINVGAGLINHFLALDVEAFFDGFTRLILMAGYFGGGVLSRTCFGVDRFEVVDRSAPSLLGECGSFLTFLISSMYLAKYSWSLSGPVFALSRKGLPDCASSSLVMGCSLLSSLLPLSSYSGCFVAMALEVGALTG